MPEPNWNDRYASGDAPWDTGAPDEHLVEFVRAGHVKPCGALEIGCGTGTNAMWLAEQQFNVLGVDLSPLAIEKARAKAAASTRGPWLRFEERDFLAGALPSGTVGFVFDRGCFHVFERESDRDVFANRVGVMLAPGGLWLSLIGSTEGPPRDIGPPRRTAREIIASVEPWLEIVELRTTTFAPRAGGIVKAWLLVARRREVPAQPSTRYA